MLKRFLSFAFLTCIFFIATNICAMEVSLLDANFERLKGKSIPYEVPFYAEEGMGTLILSNGSTDGNYRISSATVTLNGEVIVTPNDMNQDVSGLTCEVYLLPENVLFVELTSAPESFIDISVRQEVFADAKKIIDSEGGMLEVTDQGSPLFGTTLDIPSGALSEPTTITITALETPPETPAGMALTGQVVNLGPEGTTFDQPITLTLKYSDSNNDGIIDGTVIDEVFINAGYFNETTQEWEQLEIIARDFQKNTVSLVTNHFSIYSPFIRANNVVPQSTQHVSNSSITVDGDPSDWVNLTPTRPDPDPEYDSVCGPGSDIKNVYTAIDDDYAYLMVEMHDGFLNQEITVGFNVDIRPGKDLVYTTYGDFGMNVHGPNDSDWPGGVSTWSDSSTIGFHHHPTYPVQGLEVMWENIKNEQGIDVLELKIPLEVIEPNKNVQYFNVTHISTNINNWVGRCDVDAMYPKIDWFRMQKRLFASNSNKESHIRFGMSQITREGNYLTDPNYIASVKVVTPEPIETINFGKDDLLFFTEEASYGSYNDFRDVFYYGQYSLESGLYKKYTTDDDFNNFNSRIGTYTIEVTDNDGNIYETDYVVTKTTDITPVDSNTINCSIDIDKNLTCRWTYPNFDADEVGLEPQLNALPHFKAMKKNIDGNGNVTYEMLRILRVKLHYIWEKEQLHNEIIITNNVLNELIYDADELWFAVRTRIKNDNVRSYSAEIPIDISGF